LKLHISPSHPEASHQGFLMVQVAIFGHMLLIDDQTEAGPLPAIPCRLLRTPGSPHFSHRLSPLVHSPSPLSFHACDLLPCRAKVSKSFRGGSCGLHSCPSWTMGGLLLVHKRWTWCPLQSVNSLQAGTIQEISQQFSFYFHFLDVYLFLVAKFVVMYQVPPCTNVL
jgi:hypothetical protein